MWQNIMKYPTWRQKVCLVYKKRAQQPIMVYLLNGSTQCKNVRKQIYNELETMGKLNQ